MFEGTIFPREKSFGDKIKGDNIFYDTGIIYRTLTMIRAQ